MLRELSLLLLVVIADFHDADAGVIQVLFQPIAIHKKSTASGFVHGCSSFIL